MAYYPMLSLPSQTFFNPTPNFWVLLDQLVPSNVQLIDSGCGMGHLIDQAKTHDRAVIGIDINRRDNQNPDVMYCDAVYYEWSPTVWPLICRPDHSGWAYQAAFNARNAGSTVIYAGLPSNYQQDFGYIRSADYGAIGEDGEHLYLIKPFVRQMKNTTK